MSKLGLLVAGATGYVLGARAGRERYDQIVAVATRFWKSPPVQQAQLHAQDYAREKAPEVGEKISEVAKVAAVKAKAPEVGEKIGEVAKAAAAKATAVVTSIGSDDTGSGSAGSSSKSATTSSESSGSSDGTAKRTATRKATAKTTAKKTTAKRTTPKKPGES